MDTEDTEDTEEDTVDTEDMEVTEVTEVIDVVMADTGAKRQRALFFPQAFFFCNRHFSLKNKKKYCTIFSLYAMPEPLARVAFYVSNFCDDI